MTHRRKLISFALLLVLGIGTLLWSFRWQDEPSPIAEAYSDGFEVIVVDNLPDGKIHDVRALLLTEGEANVAADRDATFLLPLDTRTIQDRLRSKDPQRSDFQVNVAVVGSEVGPQEIEIHYSYGNRSYSYAYRTDGKRIWPSWSSGADLGGRRRVTYVASHN